MEIPAGRVQNELVDAPLSGRNGETVGLLSDVSVERYDGVGERITGTADSGSSWFTSVFLVVNAALGAGLLNFPAAYHTSGGLAIAIGIQLLLVGFIFVSLIVLVYCSDVEQSATYQDVVYSMCGKHFRTACSIGIVLYTFGTCITFFIIIGDQWDKFLTFAYGADYCLHWYMERKFTMITTCIILVLPLCFPKRIDFLKYASLIGVLAVVYIVILVIVKYFVGPINPGHINTRPDHWTDVFKVVPVICFGYQCHLSVVPIYACMAKRSVPEFSKTLVVAIGICLFAYTGTASFGYLTFGSKIQEDILLSYEPTTDVVIAVIILAIKMYFTYPILLFVGRAALVQLWTSARGLTPGSIALYEKRRRIIITLLWFISTLLIAVIVPDIGMVIDILGSLAALFAFLLPGVCLLQVLVEGYLHPVQHKHKYRLAMITAVFNIVIGTFLFGLVTTQVLMNFFQQDNNRPNLNTNSTICP